jgi:hypothetical protein
MLFGAFIINIEISTNRLTHTSRKIGTHPTISPYYDQPHRQHSLEGGRNAGGVKAFFHDLKRVRWPLNFKPSGIKKYDGSTNPAEWLEMYLLSIKATGGDSYVMTNYLPVYLSSSARTWLLGLPAGQCVPRTTYAGGSPVTSVPCVHVQELTVT